MNTAIPLVAQSLGSLLFAVVAAGADQNILAALGAGCINGSVLVPDHIMAQSLGAFHDGNIALSAANDTGLSNLGRLGAGCFDQSLFELMLAGSSNDLSLLFAAGGADIGDLAILSAGSLNSAAFLPNMIGGNSLIAQAGAADLTDILGNTTGGAGCFLQHIANDSLVRVSNRGSFSILVAVAANAAGIGGVTAIGAVGLGHNSFILVAQSRICQVTIILIELIDPDFTADGADVLHTCAKGTGCLDHFSLVPGMAQSFGVLGLGVVAAGALVGVHTALFTGSCHIPLQGSVQHQIVAQRFANSLFAYHFATVCTDNDNSVGCCAGRIRNVLDFVGMLTNLHFSSKSRSRKHGEYHHQRHEGCQQFSLHVFLPPIK